MWRDNQARRQERCDSHLGSGGFGDPLARCHLTAGHAGEHVGWRPEEGPIDDWHLVAWPQAPSQWEARGAG